ncbi:hypothetical protein AB4455_10240 [Vibrio sp. 10N.261.46.E12]|uniref:hypothetical protein n=1 Tax=unclassified Vibrio TaxID=2614977 RepID=UPI0009785E91|nr:MULTISPECIES: hypothetical protein [unclassified Vibrio]OMO36156.1 hypothetical protein BH584_05110 [Vibrio sp. 10N.261.45.E1]PMJ34492.1 hypothetical protein BCU27_03425 [Vibrio sp. 10N.286.45.B6]PML88020.1 hypothetical protein BCT66_10495 [Vibrio sp. 10N.261.49.E11]PMM67347.1 hypothetical protein BCT48_14965 [Vibrio sp. 10N.261.46.F12]PMM81769.1 hypothetical protein BCT46_15290 [Vibrio sp. 10N.261.46.E8]
MKLQGLLMQQEQEDLEIIRVSNERFEQGEGVVQLDPKWPSEFINKVKLHFLERSKGAEFKVVPFHVVLSSDQSPWEFGFVAFYAGNFQSDNPYECPTDDCYWWNQGYECAKLDSKSSLAE